MKKQTPAQVFFIKIYEIFKNIYLFIYLFIYSLF